MLSTTPSAIKSTKNREYRKRYLKQKAKNVLYVRKKFIAKWWKQIYSNLIMAIIEDMKIIIDKDKCIGCSMCEDISEGAMGPKFGTDGKAEVNPEADFTDRVVVANAKMAAETCPMQAIMIEED